MHGVAAAALHLNDVPLRTVRGAQHANVGRLAAALGEEDGVVQDDLEQRLRLRLRGRALRALLARVLAGRRGGRLVRVAADDGGRELAQERVAWRGT